MSQQQITIIGGGLAGLTAAIHLTKFGVDVTVIEKNSYPRHKVCGEYISNEVLPYLATLDINIDSLQPSQITQLQFSTQSGKSVNSKLPLGGFGISRYLLDDYLYKKAIDNGCQFIQENVQSIQFINNIFQIKTDNSPLHFTDIVIGAFGKRSNIDVALERNFINQKSNWLAVKAHYKGDLENNLVGLHSFDGGYCGVSKVENNIINICYLTNYNSFKKHKNIDDFQNNVLKSNPFLNYILENSTLIFDKPLTISQISFCKKKAVENHILMIGDSAGLIHPLCGNGMAMAIHSAKIVAENVLLINKSHSFDRLTLENNYTKQWNYHFKQRLTSGRILSNLLQKSVLSNALLHVLTISPFLLTIIIKKTHGKPF